MPFATIETYEIYLAVHILAAVLWVGGAFTLQLLAIRASRPAGRIQLGSLSAEIEWVGTRVFIPSSLLLVIFGFAMMGERDLPYELWVVFALAVWLASFLVGAGFLGPESGRLAKAIERYGVESEEATQRLRRIFLISRVELVFLLLVVLDMALKPGS